MGIRVPDTNLVVIAGRITRDPELQYTGAGVPHCKISIANTRYYRTKDNEKKEDTVFVDVTTWNKQAEFVAQIGKGRPVIVEGRLKFEEWEDKATGQRRTKVGIVAHRVSPLDWGDKEDKPETTQPEPQTKQDDIPF